jgi:tRNA-modifying protein YgfZ
LAANSSAVILERGRLSARGCETASTGGNVLRLREQQTQCGAVFRTQADDRSPPLHFGSAREEYAAATTRAAVFDLGERTLLELSGSDRARFLHSFCTNDIKGLKKGDGCEAFVPNVKGRVLGHVFVDATESSLWIEADPAQAERLTLHFERYVINENVAIADRTADWGELLVVGPEAANRLGRLGFDVTGLENLEHLNCDLGGTVRVRRFDVEPHRGFAVWDSRDLLGELWDRLCRADVRPAGSEVWTALRIEAGLPVYGVDISDENLAQEVGRTKTAISFSKGCYLGQEPIARIDAMGHVNRELRSLRLAGEFVPPAGSRIFADAAGSTPVGTITSSGYSFGSNSPVAMAVLRSTVSARESRVFVQGPETPVEAAVFWQPALG